MAEEEITTIGVCGKDDYQEQGSLRSLLASEGRDYLVRNDDEKVKITELKGKTVGLYFSALWCGACRRFTPILVEAYTELLSMESSFEIVFVSADEDEEEFAEYFTKMPWLAIPFFEEKKRGWLSKEFDVQGIPTLVILDENGDFLSDDAARAVRDYGAEGFPFTAEKIEKLEEEKEAARLNQSISSLLVTKSRDFLVTSNFKRVPVSELEGKIVGLYFTLSSFEACAGFTRRLVNVYNDLKGRGENFEIVLVSLEEDESSFMDDFEDMPWLGIPFRDKLCEKLVQYFELADLPTLVIIGANGKTVNANAAELVEDYGVEAYPFNSKKVKELRKKEKAWIESQTLESFSFQVPVVDLVGKNILLFFSAHWCPPCRVFSPRLIEISTTRSRKEMVPLRSSSSQATKTRNLSVNTSHKCHGWLFLLGTIAAAS
ncbi:hypothetical protein HPP92_015579 [Vanilla planifolia]|uniref:protein-disulfide reductase n=1 Tax=Vanilla planifolia TaxID=51239 RepID=A0A835QLY6_VANPL|nr:hypothetical protein HPP92_015579 [Vanilla planifolia]